MVSAAGDFVFAKFFEINVVEQQCPVKYLIPVEQPAFRGKPQLFLRSGLSIRAGGPGFSPASKGHN